jgi:GGDEF domain-containing protein
VETYGIERGDVLLSLQLILTREEDHQPVLPAREPAVAPRRPAEEPAEGSRLRTQIRSVVPTMRPPRDAAAAMGRAPVPAPPPRPIVMVDPDTGAGTLQALRRDLDLHRQETNGQGFANALVALDLQALDQLRLVMGEHAAEDVVKGLVEVAPFALRARDRVYRSGRDQLMLLLPGTDDDGVEAARWGLEMALGRFLSDRGFPEVRLAARRIDPAALAG